MAKPSLLLDTVVLVDHLNGLAAATAWLKDRKPGEAVISLITRAEVLAGAYGAEEEAVRRLLDGFPCLSPGPETADLAARLRRDHGWKLPDAFQAALAEEHGLKLVTRNTRDFPPARHLFVLVPYQLTGGGSGAPKTGR